MSDLATVRAEIKSWEREFIARHGIDPSVEDIRAQPLIAQKYKLYKKLSKVADSASHPVVSTSIQVPSTPPRAQPSSSRAPIPKSRPVENAPPLPGFNPFSPVKKNKGITKDGGTYASQSLRISPSTNPFATPAKNKPTHRTRTKTPSPHTFPSILPSQPKVNSPPSHGPDKSVAAVSRARKRLRGEPISPSPNKSKRQRIRSQGISSLARLEDSSNSKQEPDGELPPCDFNSSFVDDSPVKAPAGGKSFKLLFDDALLALPMAMTLTAPSGSHPHHSNSGPDPLQSSSVGPSAPTTSFNLRRHEIKPKGISSKPDSRFSGTQGKIPTQIFPTKDSLPTAPHRPILTGTLLETFQLRTSVKRALDGDDLAPAYTQHNTPLQTQYPLIPPSPPPHDSTNRDSGKGKAKMTASRKKLKTDVEEDDGAEDSPDDDDVKVVTVSRNRVEESQQRANDLDLDPLLHFGTRYHDPDAKEWIDANHHASGTFSVDLPEKLHRVLAISASESQNGKEERLVRGLLYGDRVEHYDPSRGGDIWDAGEADESLRCGADPEDDWEGEPVPWEIGEL